MHEPSVFKSHAVYTKQLWADAWSLRADLRAPEFSFACAPDMSDATLEYRYGNVMRMGSQNFAVSTPLDLSNRYVKIVVDGGPTWYGLVIDTMNDRGGEHEVNGVQVIRGTQTFICRGLEYLLARTPIDFSWVEELDGGEHRIERGIAFNLGVGLPSSADRESNQSTGLGAKGTYIFTSSLSTALPWKAHEIVWYLLKYCVPTDNAGVDSLGWFANYNTLRWILDSYQPVIQTHGKSFFQVLNEIIDRRRLMSWYVYVDPNNEHPEIRLFTFAPNPVAFPDGQVIPANANQVANWDFDRDNQVQKFVLASDDASKFDRVVARGEPLGGVFTVEGAGDGGNGLLETDWTTAQQTAYRAGATADAAYAAMDSWERHSANQQARTKDSLKKVFRYFRISPDDFDGYIGFDAIWPTFNPLVSAACWWPGLRLQDRLPLRLEHDYRAPLAVTNAMKTDSKWEYQRPFAWFHEPTTGRNFFLDRMSRGESIGTHVESSGRFWSCSLRMQDDAFGIILDVQGAPQHTIAKNSFTPIDDDDAVDYDASVDYTYIRATVFAEADQFAEEVFPRAIPNFDYIKELIVVVPNARKDYLVPGTVIDIDNDGTLVTTLGGYVRDDSGYLRKVAQAAYEWYSQPRLSVQVTIRDLAETRVRGELVLAIGGADNAEVINSCVTKATYNMRSGTATYLTQFAELDLS